MNLKEITNFLEYYAPLQLQESYDNAGLLVGQGYEEIKKAIVSLDCTEAVIDEAIENGANLIISHHPIVFSGLKKLNGKTYIERVIMKAIKHNIALYAIHTNLDNVIHGVNFAICEKLGLKNGKILSPKNDVLRKLVTYCPVEHIGEVRDALFTAGAGKIGHYSECSFTSTGEGTFKAAADSNPFVGQKEERHFELENRIEVIYPAYLEGKIVESLKKVHPYEEVAYDLLLLENKIMDVGSGMIAEFAEDMRLSDFLDLCKNKFHLHYLKHTTDLGKMIKKVALCGGSGSFLLAEAIAQEADVFVSADFKYHQFFDANNKIVIVDIGHYESEQFTMNLLLGIIQNKFPTFAISLTKMNTNPVFYY